MCTNLHEQSVKNFFPLMSRCKHTPPVYVLAVRKHKVNNCSYCKVRTVINQIKDKTKFHIMS